MIIWILGDLVLAVWPGPDGGLPWIRGRFMVSIQCLLLILFIASCSLGIIFFIAWKTDRVRWLVWLVPLLFVGTIFCLAWRQDHDFWRSTAVISGAQEAAAHGDRTRALKLARRPGPGTRTTRSMGLSWGGFISMPAREGGAGDRRPDDGPGPGAPGLDDLCPGPGSAGAAQEALDKLAWYLQRQPDDRTILARPQGSPAAMRIISPGDYLLSATLRPGPGPPGAAAAGETAGIAKPV